MQAAHKQMCHGAGVLVSFDPLGYRLSNASDNANENYCVAFSPLPAGILCDTRSQTCVVHQPPPLCELRKLGPGTSGGANTIENNLASHNPDYREGGR
jgi:hypothetical protein